MNPIDQGRSKIWTGQMVKDLLAERDRLEAENARYRAALIKIENCALGQPRIQDICAEVLDRHENCDGAPDGGHTKECKMKMSDLKWVFNYEEFVKAVNCFTMDGVWGQLPTFVQTACENHSRKKIKKFADAIKANVPQASCELIDDLLEKEGIGI